MCVLCVWKMSIHPCGEYSFDTNASKLYSHRHKPHRMKRWEKIVAKYGLKIVHCYIFNEISYAHPWARSSTQWISMSNDFDTLNTDQQWLVVCHACYICAFVPKRRPKRIIFSFLLFVIGHTKLLHFVTHNSYVLKIWYLYLYMCAVFFVCKNVHIIYFSYVHSAYHAMEMSVQCPPTNPISKYRKWETVDCHPKRMMKN